MNILEEQLTQLEKISELDDGWYNGDGEAPTEEVQHVVAEFLHDLYEADAEYLQKINFFADPEGGIQAESDSDEEADEENFVINFYNNEEIILTIFNFPKNSEGLEGFESDAQDSAIKSKAYENSDFTSLVDDLLEYSNLL